MNELFNDWRWQLKNCLRNAEDLKRHLSADVHSAFEGLPDDLGLPFAVTPYFASLMDGTKSCPIYLQMIPQKQEYALDAPQMRDPLGEEEREAVPHLIHRYPDRVLFFATDRCASYCRFCTRKRLVGQGPTPTRDEQERAFQYIEQAPQIKEIIFSGGDPLMLSSARLEELFTRALAIPHIEVVRLHSRMLSFAPMRIDDDLADVFRRFSPIYLVTHFNHPREITPQAIEAIAKLQNSGVLLLNQAVLLQGINDTVDILSTLFRTLVRHKVRPYYLHQCDLVDGAAHFRVPIKRALDLLEHLRGHISGLCMPTFVIDIPGGHGKVPLVPNPIVDEDEEFIYLKGFSGGIRPYPKI